MHHKLTVSEALQSLKAKGYHLADTAAEQPEESPQPNDWRLDSVHKVQEEGKKALLIAVSSASRSSKLVFVESTFSASDFSPLNLFRKLFPKKNK